jgi:hypothetical protein
MCIASIGMSLALAATFAQAAAAPEFRLSAGIDGGNYFRSAENVKKMSNAVPISVQDSKGSIDNLDCVTAGTADGGFVQSDALLVYSARNARAISAIERAGVLYKEHAHLLCNRNAGIGRVTDLNKSHTLARGPDGSGGAVTWDSFRLADKKRYEPVNVDTRGGTRALAAVADGSQVQCFLWVGALNASFIKNEASQYGDRIVLVPTDDWDMGKVAKDARGAAVYDYAEIPAGTYPRLQPTGTVYGTKAVKTITVDALFVTSTAWINTNEAAYDRVLKAFQSAKPAIEKIVNPE